MRKVNASTQQVNSNASRIPLVLTTLAVLVLVGVVAVASTGSAPSGTSDERRPADILLDTFFSLGLLALIPAAVLFVYGLMQRKEIAQEIASGRYRRTSVAAYLVFFLLLTVAVYFRLRNSDFTLGGDQGDVGDVSREGRVPPSEIGQDENAYEAEFAWIPVLVVIALAAIGALAYVLASRRRKALRKPPDAAAAETLADVLDDTLDDLRAEPDPRRAVIAAYARLERALAASGLPRWQAETAEEYVARILDRLEVDGAPVRTLTDLFTWAKFSQYDVDDTMKEAAIEALTQIRDELREAARPRQEEGEPAPPAQEQAAPS